jgi:PIN domain nuclease of toxin-antitoxin system
VRFLLDTQALLWHSAGDSRLSGIARSIIDGDDTCVISIASLWEISIKYSLGRLAISNSFEHFAGEAIEKLRLSILDISLAHLAQAAALPFHHRDSFDRLMIAQAIVEGIETVSVDSVWDTYGVLRRW